METLFDQAVKSRLEREFDEFDRENPQVWNLFVEFAWRAIKKGFKRYGAKTIFEAIRYRFDIETNGSKFKLNNDYTAYYARKFHRIYPQYDGFFETRKVKL